MKIIQQRKRINHVEYSLCFMENGSGYGFPCDENGVVVPAKAASENLAKCRAGTAVPTIEKREWSWVEPRIGRCQCGAEVELEHFTNTCDCGRDYNMSGQELAPREQWGEETGESLSDILSIA